MVDYKTYNDMEETDQTNFLLISHIELDLFFPFKANNYIHT